MNKQEEFQKLNNQLQNIMDEVSVMMESGRSEEEILTHSKTIEPINKRLKELSDQILEDSKKELKSISARKNKFTNLYTVSVILILLILVIKLITN